MSNVAHPVWGCVLIEKGISMSQSRKTTASRNRASRQPGKILDLFAGAGGWEEGLRPLGLDALGIELEPWACKTAEAAGHARLQADLSTLDPQDYGPLWGLIGSPPCQAYSTAGKGLGRTDKPLVIACAHELTIGNDTRERRRRECRDPRSLLTVEPLRFALGLRPRWIALEQVPGVLELWTLFAELLASQGYRTAAGVLRAECYGVPQTRRRAFLIASLDGPVTLPAATHRSYDARRRETPPGELGLLPWVSIAQALGCTTDGVVQTNNQTNSGRRPCGLTRPLRAPAHTLDTASGSWTFHGRGGRWVFRNRPRHPECLRGPDEPAPTIIARGHQSWVRQRPATTVACDSRIARPGAKRNASRPGAPGRSEGAVRVSVEQAAVLQGFPADYPWQGARGRQFQQVGNAVPPLLARRVIEAVIYAGGAS
jgi:DNA (cytosine-5)-methyltransferase 1